MSYLSQNLKSTQNYSKPMTVQDYNSGVQLFYIHEVCFDYKLYRF